VFFLKIWTMNGQICLFNVHTTNLFFFLIVFFSPLSPVSHSPSLNRKLCTFPLVFNRELEWERTRITKRTWENHAREMADPWSSYDENFHGYALFWPKISSGFDGGFNPFHFSFGNHRMVMNWSLIFWCVC